MVLLCLPSDALSQHLPSYLGFSGRGVSLHGCSSKVQPLLLTLDEGYLLTAAPPDLEHGVLLSAFLRPCSHHSLDVGLLLSAAAPDLGHGASRTVLWKPTRPFRTKTQKDVLFIIGDWNAKVGSQKTPGVTDKFGLGVQNEAGQRLIEFYQENTLVIANTLFQEHKRKLYTGTLPDGQCRNQIDYILCRQRWRSSIQSAKTRPGADCGSDHELLIAKFKLKLKKVGKTTRPFRYDLNKNPYDYTVEVRNRFKELDLIDRVPDELWTEVYDIVQETGVKTIPMEKKCKKAKWFSEEALQIAVKRREVKSKGEKER